MLKKIVYVWNWLRQLPRKEIKKLNSWYRADPEEGLGVLLPSHPTPFTPDHFDFMEDFKINLYWGILEKNI